MKLKISCYVNHNASKDGCTSSILQIFKKQLFRHDLKVIHTSSIYELNIRIKDDIENKTEIIVAFGGDGTANAIAQMLVGTSIKFFIIPTGTANDLAFELGLDLKPKCFHQLIKHHSYKKIDVIKINDKIMLTNGGIGFATDAALIINTLREKILAFKTVMKWLGPHVYTLSAYVNLLIKKFKLQYLEIDTEQEVLKIKTSVVLVCNQARLGKNFLISKDIDNTDGLVDVIYFLHQNKFEMAKTLIQAFLPGRSLIDDPLVKSVRAKNLTITSLDNQTLHFFGDGEDLVNATQLKISVLPKLLTVYTYQPEHRYYSSYSLDNLAVVSE